MGALVTPDDNETAVQAIIDDTTELVTDRFGQAMDYADGIMNIAQGFLSALQSNIGGFYPNYNNLSKSFPWPISPSFNPVDPPTAPEVELYLPELPIYPVLQAISLITGIRERLESDLANGVTGLNAGVENDIWRRQEERDRIALDDAKEKAAAEWSKRGFALPDGVLAANLQQIETEYMNKRTDVSRDIAIKQAELAFQNGQFVIQQIMAMETILINGLSKGNEISIEGYKADIEGYRARVQGAIEKVSARIKKYEAGATVYRAKAESQAAIAQVDVKAAEAEMNMTIAQMQLFLKQVELSMRNSEVMTQLRVSAAEAGGRIAAALASGIFSGVSVQANISGSGSATKGYSGSELLSESHPHKEHDP